MADRWTPRREKAMKGRGRALWCLRVNCQNSSAMDWTLRVRSRLTTFSKVDAQRVDKQDRMLMTKNICRGLRPSDVAFAHLPIANNSCH